MPGMTGIGTATRPAAINAIPHPLRMIPHMTVLLSRRHRQAAGGHGLKTGDALFGRRMSAEQVRQTTDAERVVDEQVRRRRRAGMYRDFPAPCLDLAKSTGQG